MARTPMYHRWAERGNRNAAPGTAERVRADYALASVLLRAQGRYADAWMIKQRSLELARKLNDPELLFITALSFLGSGRSPRREAEVLQLAEELAAAPREGVGARTLALGLNRAASALLQYGYRSRAEELSREENELATRTHDAQILLLPFRMEQMIATLDGDLEGAVRASERLVARPTS